MNFTKAFKFGGSEGTVSSSCVGLTLLCRFGEARLRRERQARSDVLSLWVTYLPQRVRSVALRALFPFARVSLQRRTLLSLVGEAHLRREGRRALTCSHDWYDIFPKHSRIGGSEGTVSSSCGCMDRITLLGLLRWSAPAAREVGTL